MSVVHWSVQSVREEVVAVAVAVVVAVERPLVGGWTLH